VTDGSNRRNSRGNTEISALGENVLTHSTHFPSEVTGSDEPEIEIVASSTTIVPNGTRQFEAKTRQLDVVELLKNAYNTESNSSRNSSTLGMIRSRVSSRVAVLLVFVFILVLVCHSGPQFAVPIDVNHVQIGREAAEIRRKYASVHRTHTALRVTIADGRLSLVTSSVTSSQQRVVPVNEVPINGFLLVPFPSTAE
jgi:hypothetical protein